MNILLVEDETKTSAYIKKGLEENQYLVEIASDGKLGLELAKTGDYEVIILDIMLPGLDGWHILSELRKQDLQTPVLILTARDEVHDRVRGLEEGADDYLIKPFAFSELLARVRSLTRRKGVPQVQIVTIGSLKVDLLRHQVSREGKLIQLTPKEFALLALLIEHRGEVLSRTIISEKIWGMYFDGGTNIVDVAIRRLRLKVEKDDSEKIIQTVRGVGYMIVDSMVSEE